LAAAGWLLPDRQGFARERRAGSRTFLTLLSENLRVSSFANVEGVERDS
jgi:hypothetical protein